ncbi:MAG: hypothetical protein HQK97_07535, partial [Nitrospirae bacterium]|nr:hypothetical protein [Nitrospirota bacterium]
MADQTLKFIIEAVTKGFDGLKNLMTPLNDGLTQAKAQIQSADSAFKSAFQASGTEGAMSGITASLGSFMVSIGAAAAAYEAFRALLSAPLKGFEFNKDMETGRLGIASIITATTELISQDGRRLSGMEKLNEAQKVAADLMKQLQIAGLETTATTQQLVEAFQGYIAPATAAGLTMKQTKEYTLMMVQALGAMGMPMNQLAQEGRSILEGAITPINSRLATALGISNDMVAQWKAGGTLWQELTKRLEAFKLSGQAIANTWTGMSSNMKDAISYLTGKMTEGMFESIKSSWLSLLNTLVSTKGDIGVGADIKNIFEGAKIVVDDFGKLLQRGVAGFISILKDGNRYIGTYKDEFGVIYAKVEDVGNAFLKLIGSIASAVVEVVKFGVETGAIATSLTILEVLIAGIQDGLKTIVLVFQGIGTLILDIILKPFQLFYEYAAKGLRIVGLDKAADQVESMSESLQGVLDHVNKGFSDSATAFGKTKFAVNEVLNGHKNISSEIDKQKAKTDKATSSVEAMAKSYDVVKQNLELQNKKLSEGLTLLDERTKKRTMEIEVKYSGTAGGVDRDNKIYADTLKVRQDYYKQLTQFAQDYDKKQALIFADETKNLNLSAEAQMKTIKDLEDKKRAVEDTMRQDFGLDASTIVRNDQTKALDAQIAKERTNYEDIATLQSKILQLKIKTAQEAQSAVGKALDQSLQKEKKYADEVTKLNQDIKNAKISLNSELAALDRSKMSDDQKAVNEYRTGIQLRGQAFLEMVQGNYDTAKQLASESKSLISEAAKSGYVDFRQAREQYRL